MYLVCPGLCFEELVDFMLTLQYDVCVAFVITWKSRDRNHGCIYPHSV